MLLRTGRLGCRWLGWYGDGPNVPEARAEFWRSIRCCSFRSRPASLQSVGRCSLSKRSGAAHADGMALAELRSAELLAGRSVCMHACSAWAHVGRHACGDVCIMCKQPGPEIARLGVVSRLGSLCARVRGHGTRGLRGMCVCVCMCMCVRACM